MRRSYFLTAGVLVSLLFTSCASKETKQIRTYAMGERVQLGHLIYTVFETQWLTQIGQGPTARVPQQRFFTIRLSITNAGSTDTVAPSLQLVADNGQTVAEVTDGEGVNNWLGQIRPVKPAESAQGAIVFDVAPAHYKLRLADDTEENVAFVDIPLSFASETQPTLAVQSPDPTKEASKDAVRNPADAGKNKKK